MRRPEQYSISHILQKCPGSNYPLILRHYDALEFVKKYFSTSEIVSSERMNDTRLPKEFNLPHLIIAHIIISWFKG